MKVLSEAKATPPLSLLAKCYGELLVLVAWRSRLSNFVVKSTIF